MAQLDLLPDRTESAATNMATDFLLLQHYPARTHARLRHYGWQRPAVTFGYSQKIAWVREQLDADLRDAELCRRPTGGGVVDHRHDWTYALVIPRGHDLGDAPALQSYEAVHRAIATALQAQEVAAELKTVCEPCGDDPDMPNGPGICFARPERFDVMRRGDGVKLAGAAQKRSKHGLLFQGSVDQQAAGAIDWDRFAADFAAQLAAVLGWPAEEAPWPDAWDEPVDALAESYASPEWIERR